MYTIRIGNVTAPDNPLNPAFERMALRASGPWRVRPAIVARLAVR